MGSSNFGCKPHKWLFDIKCWNSGPISNVAKNVVNLGRGGDPNFFQNFTICVKSFEYLLVVSITTCLWLLVMWSQFFSPDWWWSTRLNPVPNSDQEQASQELSKKETNQDFCQEPVNQDLCQEFVIWGSSLEYQSQELHQGQLENKFYRNFNKHILVE